MVRMPTSLLTIGYGLDGCSRGPAGTAPRRGGAGAGRVRPAGGGGVPGGRHVVRVPVGRPVRGGRGGGAGDGGPAGAAAPADGGPAGGGAVVGRPGRPRVRVRRAVLDGPAAGRRGR